MKKNGTGSFDVEVETGNAQFSEEEAEEERRSRAMLRMRRWQLITLVTLMLVYTALMCNRSNLSVATPAIIENLGFDDGSFGVVVGTGTAVYAVGKLCSGAVVDVIGGPVLLQGVMLTSGTISILFSFGSSILYFAFFNALNKLVQSIAWPSLVKIAAVWFFPNEIGSAMGVISWSFLFGDAVIRIYLGTVLSMSGDRWQNVYYASSASLFLVLAASLITMHPSPKAVGLPDIPSVSVRSSMESGGDEQVGKQAQLMRVLLIVIRDPRFYALCGMSVCLTFIRQVFFDWLALFYTSFDGVDGGMAAIYSASFPLAGGISSIVVGVLNDRLDRFSSCVAVTSMIGLAALSTMGIIVMRELWICIILITLIALFSAGPYTLLAGAFSVRVGGKEACATTCALVDTAGYCGGLVASSTSAWISRTSYGWTGVWFAALTMLIFAMLFSVFFFALDYWQQRGRVEGIDVVEIEFAQKVEETRPK